jgi:PAS domain S-box-containing protein
VRFNAAAMAGLAFLVGGAFLLQASIVRAVDVKVEECVNLRLHFSTVRITLYESGIELDEKKMTGIISDLDAVSPHVDEVAEGFFGLTFPGVKSSYEAVRLTADDLDAEIKSFRRTDRLENLRIGAQREIFDATTVCSLAENEFKLLGKRVRLITSIAVSAAAAAAAAAAVALSLFFSGRIGRAADKLVSFSAAIAAGKTDREISYDEDEFSPVYDAMLNMSLSRRRVHDELEREEARLRRVGKELRETSEFLDKIVTNASAPIVVWGTDFTITMFNRAFERMTLYRAGEVIGKRLSMLFSEETAADSFRKITRALEGEQWDSVDMPVRRKDGSIRIVLWNSANILDNDGSVAATVAQGQDITDRIETLRELKASERRFRMLFSEMQTGFALHEILCDGSGNPIDYRFLEINPAFEKLLGRNAEDVIGRTVRTIMPGTEQYWIDNYGAVALSGEPRRFENYASEIGRYFEVVAYSPERMKFAVLFSDITERKQAEAKIIQMNAELERKVEERTIRLETYTRELEAFSYSVSHDLRAPLRSIEGFGAALEEDFGALLPADAHDYITRIRNATTRMGNLIDDLLSLSRITRSEIVLSDFNISAMFQSVFDELAAASLGRHARVEIQPDVYVRGDPRLVLIVVTNLASNAWKFTSRRSDSQISFSARDENGRALCVLSDNGAGFDMKWYDKLFGAFQRLHSAQDFPGTGIGLAIAQRVIAKHGGTIRAESEPGKGASFLFTLS